jgi:hypothetical protein
MQILPNFFLSKQYTKLIFLLEFFLFISLLNNNVLSQNICNDFLSNTYNQNQNCEYLKTLQPIKESIVLDKIVRESSGLAKINGKLWTINDSGNESYIYQIDSLSGSVKRKVFVGNAKNKDWESLATSDKHLYIGDFGNNKGKRKDLVVLKISIEDLLNKDTVTAKKIEFNFPDQTTFDNKNHEHNFDCEAFFFKDDSLHLFTKNWKDYKTKYYTMPSKKGTYTANLKSEFDVNGLITAADYNKKLNYLVLLGYDKNVNAFIWLLNNFEGNNFFGGNKRRIELESTIKIGQVEGILINGDNSLWISAEEFLNQAPKLHKIELDNYLIGWIDGFKSPHLKKYEFSKSQKKAAIWLNFQNECKMFSYRIFDVSKKIIVEEKSSLKQSKELQLELKNLAKGNYILSIRTCEIETNSYLILKD